MTVYGELPGFKEDDTSREAAEEMQLRAGTLRRKALDYIRLNPLRTTDEIAAALGESPWAIRPRISELRRMGLVVNDRTRRQRVWQGCTSMESSE